MKNKEKNEIKKHKNTFTREYLHSISRIGDRLKILKRDINKQKQELEYMEEDIQLLTNAFDSLFTDLMSSLSENLNQKTKDIRKEKQ